MTTDNKTGWEAFYRANQTRAASPLLRRALGAECLAKGNGHAIVDMAASDVELAYTCPHCKQLTLRMIGTLTLQRPIYDPTPNDKEQRYRA